MKRLLVATFTSQHQRGFFHATALIGSVGLVGTGIVVTQQVKAHQHSHAQHIMAVKKLAAKDCGCSLLTYKGHASKLYQAVANTGVDDFDRAVALKAGQQLALGISDPSSTVQPGGTWDANFGTVDANGVYTAPRYTPPEGLDRIHYLDPNGDDVYINIRILPNADIPNSDQTPYVTMADVSSGSTQAPPSQSAQSQQTPPGTEPGRYSPPTNETVIVSDETPAPPEEISGSTPLSEKVVNGATVVMLPALFGDDVTTSVVYAQPLQETPQGVTLVPNVVPPTGPCTPGEKAVYGPVRTTYVPKASLVALADFKVDVSNKEDIFHFFKVNLAVGAVFHVQGQYYDWKQTRTKYVYQCSNKRWVLIYTRQCESLSLSLTTTPPFAILGTGFPRNNVPTPYGPEACH